MQCAGWNCPQWMCYCDEFVPLISEEPLGFVCRGRGVGGMCLCLCGSGFPRVRGVKYCMNMKIAPINRLYFKFCETLIWAPRGIWISSPHLPPGGFCVTLALSVVLSIFVILLFLSVHPSCPCDLFPPLSLAISLMSIISAASLS